jgi:hypothetical protein
MLIRTPFPGQSLLLSYIVDEHRRAHLSQALEPLQADSPEVGNQLNQLDDQLKRGNFDFAVTPDGHGLMITSPHMNAEIRLTTTVVGGVRGFQVWASGQHRTETETSIESEPIILAWCCLALTGAEAGHLIDCLMVHLIHGLDLPHDNGITLATYPEDRSCPGSPSIYGSLMLSSCHLPCTTPTLASHQLAEVSHSNMNNRCEKRLCNCDPVVVMDTVERNLIHLDEASSYGCLDAFAPQAIAGLASISNSDDPTIAGRAGDLLRLARCLPQDGCARSLRPDDDLRDRATRDRVLAHCPAAQMDEVLTMVDALEPDDQVDSVVPTLLRLRDGTPSEPLWQELLERACAWSDANPETINLWQTCINKRWYRCSLPDQAIGDMLDLDASLGTDLTVPLLDQLLNCPAKLEDLVTKRDRSASTTRAPLAPQLLTTAIDRWLAVHSPDRNELCASLCRMLIGLGPACRQRACQHLASRSPHRRTLRNDLFTWSYSVCQSGILDAIIEATRDLRFSIVHLSRPQDLTAFRLRCLTIMFDLARAFDQAPLAQRTCTKILRGQPNTHASHERYTAWLCAPETRRLAMQQLVGLAA